MSRKKSTKPQETLKNNAPTSKSSSKVEVQSCVESKEELDQKQEAEDQFELELCWCIQHLQQGLEDLKLEKKQKYNVTASLNALTNNKTSIIKKRQVMRNTFGDYRRLMAEEEKKLDKKTAQVKFIQNKKKKQSIFFKKANCVTNKSEDDKFKSTTESLHEKVVVGTDVVNEPFKFNFPLQDS